MSNLTLLDKLRDSLYEMYEHQINWNLFSEEAILKIALEVTFHGKTHDTLLRKIIQINRLKKPALDTILKKYPDSTFDILVGMVQVKALDTIKMQKYVNKFIRMNQIKEPLLTAAIIRWYIEGYGKDLSEKTNEKLSKKAKHLKARHDKAVALLPSYPSSVGGVFSGLWH